MQIPDNGAKNLLTYFAMMASALVAMYQVIKIIVLIKIFVQYKTINTIIINSYKSTIS